MSEQEGTTPVGEFRQHPKHATAAQQMDAAVRRIGGTLLDSSTVHALAAAASGIGQLIVDASVDDVGATGLAEFFKAALDLHVAEACARRTALAMISQPQGNA